MAQSKDDKAGASRRDFITQTLTGAAAASVAATAQAAAPAIPARPMSATEKFRAMLKRDQISIFPEAIDVFSARLCEVHGFDGVYTGGNMISALNYAFDDYGIVTVTELIEFGRRVAAHLDIPVLTDGDQLGETALTVHRHIKEYQRAGIAATHMEDTRNPKHQGAGVSNLMPAEEMVLRLQAAREAISDPNFTLIARTDCMILAPTRGDINEVIRRGKMFAAAGADAYFPVAIKVDQVNMISDAVGLPIVGLNIPLEASRKTKLKISIQGPARTYPVMMKFFEDQLLGLKANNEWPAAEKLAQDTIDKVQRTAKYQELTQRWNRLPKA